MTVGRVARIAGQIALSIAAITGVLCLVAALASVAFGVTPLVFRSGSMAPDIPAGSLGFARSVDAGDLQVGDVVSVRTDSSRVSHRIIEMRPAGERDGRAVELLTLKGDANSVADPAPYPVTEADRLWFSVPVLGRVISWLSTAPGVYVLAGYLALCVWLMLRRSPQPGRRRRDSGDAPPTRGEPTTSTQRRQPRQDTDRSPGAEPAAEEAGDSEAKSDAESDTESNAESDAGQPEADRPGEQAVPAGGFRGLRRRPVMLVVLVLSLLGWGSLPAQAAWTDPATVGTATISTGTVPRVGQPTCSLGGVNATISWPSAGPGLTYVIEVYRRSNGTLAGTFQAGTATTYTFNNTDPPAGFFFGIRYVAYVKAVAPSSNWEGASSGGVNFTRWTYDSCN